MRKVSVSTPLKEAIRAAGVTQWQVARFCNVAPNTVYKWAAGRAPLPAERATQIASFLGCEVGEFAGMVSEDARGTTVLKREPTTMLDWVLQNVYGEKPYQSAVAGLAFDGATLLDVRAWLYGEREIPFQIAAQLGDVLPGFNPALLMYEVEADFSEQEDRAVRKALERLDRGGGPHWMSDDKLSFQGAVEALRADWKDWERRPKDREPVRAALDNGMRYPAHWLATAKRLAGRH